MGHAKRGGEASKDGNETEDFTWIVGCFGTRANSYKQKESSAADNTDQAGSMLERNATSSHEKLRWSHFLKQKGYYQHSYLGCIIRGSRLFVRFIFFFFSWMESMAEFKVSFNYYPSSATEHRRKLSFLKKTIFLRRKNNNMGIFSSGKNAQVSKEG